jgi:hypothetical protein
MNYLLVPEDQINHIAIHLFKFVLYKERYVEFWD